jgi:DNA-binding CsgD family transcriptional regulator
MRGAPTAMVVDSDDRIIVANDRSREIIRRLSDGPDAKIEDSRLPSRIKQAVGLLRRDLRGRAAGQTAFMPLTEDVCLRACMLQKRRERFLLLLFESPRRGGTTAGSLGSYPLTPRENELVQLLLHGASNRRAAAMLDLSEHTVEAYLKRIFVKIGVRSRSGLVARVLGLDAP